MSKTATLKAPNPAPSAQQTKSERFAIEIKKQLKSTAQWYQNMEGREVS